MRNFHIIAALSLGLMLASCASEPKNEGPDWIRQPTRTVDNGYIVYVGSGESRDNEKAQFKAEGMALEDMANECSFIHKGARIEDRYILKGKNENTAYVKVALEFQECTEAQKTLEPADIKRLANASFTEQLKRYQDLEETGEMSDKSQYVAIESPGEVPPPPDRAAGWNDSTHFMVMRQYVAYQKEVVVLSAPTAYPPNSPQTTQFVSAIQPTVGQIQQTAAANPALAKTPPAWSKVYDRPHMTRPTSLAPVHHGYGYKSAAPYLKENDKMKKAAKKGNGQGRKRRHRSSESSESQH